MGEVVTLLTKHQSQRDSFRRIYRCGNCDSSIFKLLEIEGEDHLACANCEDWIHEFDLVRNMEIVNDG